MYGISPFQSRFSIFSDISDEFNIEKGDKSIVPSDSLNGARIESRVTRRDTPSTSGAIANLLPSGVTMLNQWGQVASEEMAPV